MKEVFVDTFHLVARLNPRDSAHTRASQLERQLASNSRFVTTDFVLTELLAAFSKFGTHFRRVAQTTARMTLDSPNFVVVPATRALFLDGLRRYEERPDKNFSHVDCVSMLIMEQRKIAEILSNDHGFQQAGFSLLQ